MSSCFVNAARKKRKTTKSKNEKKKIEEGEEDKLRVDEFQREIAVTHQVHVFIVAPRHGHLIKATVLTVYPKLCVERRVLIVGVFLEELRPTSMYI